MTKSEGIAYKWLLQSYDEKDIQLSGPKAPDFVCSDGKRFEVKKSYQNHLNFTPWQIDNLKDEDTIIVIDEEDKETIATFPWGQRHKTKFNITTPELVTGRKSINMMIDYQIHKKLKIRANDEGKTFKDLINEILEKEVIIDGKA